MPSNVSTTAQYKGEIALYVSSLVSTGGMYFCQYKCNTVCQQVLIVIMKIPLIRSEDLGLPFKVLAKHVGRYTGTILGKE